MNLAYLLFRLDRLWKRRGNQLFCVGYDPLDDGGGPRKIIDEAGILAIEQRGLLRIA